MDPDDRGWRERVGFTRLTLASYGAIDAVIKVVCVAGFVTSFEYPAGLPIAASLARVGLVGVPVVGAWVAALVWLARPIDRFGRSPSSASLVAETADRVVRLPRRLAVAWMAQWVVFFTVLLGTSPAPISLPAAGFFLGTMVVGPIIVGHSLGTWITAPLVRRLWFLTRELGLPARTSGGTLRTWLVFYSMCIGMAPCFYTATIAVSAHHHGLPLESLLSSIGVFVVAVIVFCTISAGLLASTITEPLGAMASIMEAIGRQGDASRVGRVPVYRRDELGAVSALTNAMLDRLEGVDRERREASASLLALNQTLERRVDERTAALAKSTAQMQLILDNIAEGLLVVDPFGRVVSEPSAALVAIFGDARPGEPFTAYFGRTRPELGEEAELGWQQVVEGFLPPELTLGQLPRAFVAAGRHHEIAYRPLDRGAGYLIVVSDATARIAKDEAQRERGEAFALFEHLTAERGIFLDFLAEGSATVTRLLSASAADAELHRALHTLKGNGLLFGFGSIGRLCHELETEIQERGWSEASPCRQALGERWAKLVRDTDRGLGERRHAIELSPAQYETLERQVRQGAPSATVLALLEDLGREPVGRRLALFAEQARRVAARLEKTVAVETEHDDLRLDPRRWSKLWSACVHAVRNAVDHGIESPGERMDADKPPAGRIVLRAHRREAGIEVEIEDDGRGIPWNRLRARAMALGLPAATDGELVDALFTDGVSSADQVTDVSGRGVGMGALRTEVMALRGQIDVESASGRGTRIRMTFPADVRVTGAPETATPDPP